jgi:beta-N-acetylhexosaminidase
MQKATGPIILDLIGPELTLEERELLQHPSVGGIILFARNYESPEQITALCQAVRNSRESPLLITVDQEGGRVQRFKKGFLNLPSMGSIGKLYQDSPEEGLRFAHCCGWLMAAEVLAVGVDLSFAPVLDLDKNWNTVIGDRAFGSRSQQVILLAKAIMQGMQEAGMAATGKHFPGHGSVTTDSHLTLPIDTRDFATVYQEDMQPFIELIQTGLDAVMPAHIVFANIADKPVGFSTHWLQEILRQRLKFSGVVISDDLNMNGANFAGGYSERAEAALNAGCDFALICNNRTAAINILEQLSSDHRVPAEKFNRLQGKFTRSLTSLHASSAWKNYFNLFVQYRKVYENN